MLIDIMNALVLVLLLHVNDLYIGHDFSVTKYVIEHSFCRVLSQLVYFDGSDVFVVGVYFLTFRNVNEIIDGINESNFLY